MPFTPPPPPNVAAQDEAEMLDELRERLENPPAPWMPTGVGETPDEAITDDSIIGVVVQAEVRRGDYGPYPYLVVKDGPGRRVSISGFGTVLGGKLATVAVGDGLAIKYNGTREPRNAKPGASPYHDYDVQVIAKGGKPPNIQPSDELEDMEVEPGVFMSELDRETLTMLAGSNVSPVTAARARAWAERAEA